MPPISSYYPSSDVLVKISDLRRYIDTMAASVLVGHEESKDEFAKATTVDQALKLKAWGFEEAQKNYKLVEATLFNVHILKCIPQGPFFDISGLTVCISFSRFSIRFNSFLLQIWLSIN